MLEPIRKPRAGQFHVDNAFRIMRHSIKTVLTKRDCWEWQGGVTLDGFPVFRSNKLDINGTVRRFVWQYCYNYVNEGSNIRAFCGNRRCVRPSHLYMPARSTPQRIRNNSVFYAFEANRIKPMTRIEAIDFVRSINGRRRRLTL
jgi:hypothetical protein